MFFKNLTKGVAGIYKKVPLQLVLVVPFVLQILMAVSLTGYLSVRNGKKAVRELAEHLSNETSDRIEQHVPHFLQAPHLVQQAIAASIRSGTLNTEDFAEVERDFWHQMQVTEAIAALYFSNDRGEFIRFEGQDSGQILLQLRDESTAGKIATYELNKSGDRLRLIESQENREYREDQEYKQYQANAEAGYRAAMEAGEPTWTAIIPKSERGALEINAVMPVARQTDRKPIGALGIAVTLADINKFLQGLEMTPNGQAFILDRNGNLVASSGSESGSEINLAAGDSGVKQQLHSLDSKDTIVKGIAKHLLKRFGSFQDASDLGCTFVEIDDEEQLFQISTLDNKLGLDWLIVVVIPEADFLGHIQANTRTTILLCLAALAIAIFLGLKTSQWIAKPILRLNAAAKNLASGEWTQPVSLDRADEIGELALSFNWMAKQLQDSLARLEKSNAELEMRVEKRTAQLRASESAVREKQQYLRLILDNIPQQVFWKDTNLVFKGCNKHWSEAVGLESPEVVEGKTDYDLLDDRKVAESFRRQDSRIIKTGTPVLHVVVKKEKAGANGQDIWLDLNKIPMQDSEGNIIGILGVLEDITTRKLAEDALRAEQQNSERLLLNILPEPIAEQLKQEQSAIADYFDCTTILFSDIVGFTDLSSRMSPIKLVNLLNRMFSQFDKLADRHGLEKIKTIGDAYMVAGGLPVHRSDHAEAVADMALEMQAAMKNFQAEIDRRLQIRIGINTGPVVAGVIGIKKFIYDLWGDTVNVASRMESSGVPGRIQVTKDTYHRLKDKYLFDKRGEVDVKGKGEMTTYWLCDRKAIF
ncbi:MAG: PAS domain-containing protein [Oscillatoria sp. SIO1A7]|nr:PAS domain-containing protein [Oscillatoria sp. SIO1A7]